MYEFFFYICKYLFKLKHVKNIFLISILLFAIFSNYIYAPNSEIKIPLSNENQNITEKDSKNIFTIFIEIIESEIEIEEEALNFNFISFFSKFIAYKKIFFNETLHQTLEFENFKDKTPLTILYCQLKFHI